MSTPVSRTPQRLLPRVAVSAGAAALLLSGCAEATPVVTGGGTVAPATAVPSRAASGSGTTSSSPTSTPAASTSTTPAPVWPTKTINAGKTLTDTGLGHRVEIKRILRGLPWPTGYTATSQAYELVAVEMRWTPSTTYTAPLRRQDFAIRTGAKFPSRPTDLVDGALRAHGLNPMPTQVASGKSTIGWLVFKVDPKASPNLTLVYTRPKSQVSGSGQVFDTRVFSQVLTGSAVPTS